jgi:hypothetical protein
MITPFGRKCARRYIPGRFKVEKIGCASLRWKSKTSAGTATAAHATAESSKAAAETTKTASAGTIAAASSHEKGQEKPSPSSPASRTKQEKEDNYENRKKGVA